MPDSKSLSPELIGLVAAELIGAPLPERDRKPVADLLNGLMAEMSAMRSLDVGETEPAVIYEAGDV